MCLQLIFCKALYGRGIIYLFFLNSKVFLKTMILCVILCNLHGLVFLPAFLIIFDWINGLFKKYFGRKDDVQQTSHLNGIGIPIHRRSTKLDTVLEKSCSQETNGSAENGKSKF